MIAMFSDIHGCKKELERLLQTIEYKYKISKYIYLGDIIDRGPDEIGVVNLIKYQIATGKDVVLLYGNHEVDALTNKDHFFSVNHPDANEFADFRKQFKRCYKQKIGGKHFYFSHSGFDIRLYDFADVDDLRVFELYYYSIHSRDRFLYGPSGRNVQPNSIHVYGHTPSHYGSEHPKGEPMVIPHPDEPTCIDINIDTGCVYGGKLTCLLVDEDTGEYCFEAVDFEG